jgi:hypothetical protein
MSARACSSRRHRSKVPGEFELGSVDRCRADARVCAAYHPFIWRDWQDFGGGGLGDFGCHIMDPVFTALDLTAPISITAKNSGINNQIWPTHETINYVFPGTQYTAGKTMKLTWMDGGLKPSYKLAQMPGDIDLPAAAAFSSAKAARWCSRMWPDRGLYPLDKFTGFKYPKEEGRSHWHTWVDACLAGKRPATASTTPDRWPKPCSLATWPHVSLPHT